jgi:RNA polymerase sigma-70 factor, ECF subfamily
MVISNMSDEEILELSYKRPRYFGELFDRHGKRFFHIAQRNLRSKDDAEDVVQETFIRIYKYGKKFPQGGGKFMPWASTILKNCMADQINKYKKANVALTDEMIAVIPDQNSSEASENDGERNYVQFVLDKIGGVTAEIIKLRYMLGKSFKEIGKILKIKSGAARVRVYRSKKVFVQTYKQFNNYE